MLWIAAFIVMMGLAFGPTVWVRRVMQSHAADREDYPGTGGEFARHLLDHHGLDSVKVEISKQGDHYDPKAKAVRLSPQLHDGRSVTAVAVAAHEVGHALQDHEGYKPLAWCQRLITTANVTDRIGSLLIMVLSGIGAAALSPRVLLFGILAVLLIGLVRVAAHIVMLPVEHDASFRRALPIVENGRYLPEEDLPAVRSVLKAAAYTYVAASLMQVLNLFRILRAFR
ncbi:zinc metallopeptidase [Nitratireductor sp. XY-223]|uniref:zinc metallopeptidase n=1 Tax=Nitratireductor sp. XY-223 TaxID=2561926 RepID=UPI0010AA7CAA|nr:zinc metallopeptidase [Nitratireductor sp. XY-223]